MTTETRPVTVLTATAERIIRDELQLRWTLKVNPRFRSTYGMCHYGARTIELAPRFESVTECELTILHEVAHAQVHEKALLDRRFKPVVGPKVKGRADHHGQAWREAYAALLTKYGYQVESLGRGD
jgi:predicted SprT family Zn-dependent metalloprotease